MARVLLTDQLLKSLKVTGKRYDTMDLVVPGFGVIVYEKGQKSFMLLARYPGSSNPTRRIIAEYPATSLADARHKATEWRLLIKRGIDPSHEEARKRREEIERRANTFGAVVEDFIREKLASERKGKEAEQNLRREFIPVWGERPITEITDLDVVGVIRSIKARGARAQARNMLALAKRFFAWAVDQRVYGLSTSPAEALKPAKIVGEKSTGSRVLTDDEIFALWRASGRLPYPFGAVYRLLLLTGLRLNEAADASRGEWSPVAARLLAKRQDSGLIEWSQLPWEDRVWTIPADRMKGRNGKARPHEVPLTTDIAQVFEQTPKLEAGDFFFSTTFGEKPAWMSDKVKKRLDARMLKTLRALARRRGDDPKKVVLPTWTNHDIRRTVRSNLSKLRISEEAREAVLAHARPGIKGTYDHHDYFDEKREALELWAARLQKIVEPPTANIFSFRASAGAR